MKHHLYMEIRAVSVWSIQGENSKRVIEKIWSIARKQSWNQSMAAYESDTEDFETDEEAILVNKVNLKFNKDSSEQKQIQLKSSTLMNFIRLTNT